jgi:hypothetical protein
MSQTPNVRRGPPCGIIIFRKDIIAKIISLVVVCAFFVNDASFALSPGLGTQSPTAKCECQIALMNRSGQLVFADTAEEARLLPLGRYLINNKLKNNPIAVIRAINYAEIKATLTAMSVSPTERDKCLAIVNMLPDARAALPDYEGLAIQTTARAFELMIAERDDLLAERLSRRERDPLDAIKIAIGKRENAHLAGTISMLLHSAARVQELRIIEANGVSFAPSPASLAEPDAGKTIGGAGATVAMGEGDKETPRRARPASAAQDFARIISERISRIDPAHVTIKTVREAMNSDNAPVFEALALWKKSIARRKDVLRNSLDHSQNGMCYYASNAAYKAFCRILKGHKIALVACESYCPRGVHYRIEIDDSIVVDITYGQYDEKYEDKIYVGSLRSVPTSILVRKGELRNSVSGKVEPARPRRIPPGNPAQLFKEMLKEAVFGDNQKTLPELLKVARTNPERERVSSRETLYNELRALRGYGIAFKAKRGFGYYLNPKFAGASWDAIRPGMPEALFYPSPTAGQAKAIRAWVRGFKPAIPPANAVTGAVNGIRGGPGATVAMGEGDKETPPANTGSDMPAGRYVEYARMDAQRFIAMIESKRGGEKIDAAEADKARKLIAMLTGIKARMRDTDILNMEPEEHGICLYAVEKSENVLQELGIPFYRMFKSLQPPEGEGIFPTDERMCRILDPPDDNEVSKGHYFMIASFCGVPVVIDLAASQFVMKNTAKRPYVDVGILIVPVSDLKSNDWPYIGGNPWRGLFGLGAGLFDVLEGDRTLFKLLTGMEPEFKYDKKPGSEWDRKLFRKLRARLDRCSRNVMAHGLVELHISDIIKHPQEEKDYIELGSRGETPPSHPLLSRSLCSRIRKAALGQRRSFDSLSIAARYRAYKRIEAALNKKDSTDQKKAETDLLNFGAEIPRIEITVPDRGLEEERIFTESLGTLESVSRREFVKKCAALETKTASYEGRRQSLILYADDLLENAVVTDLEHAVKNILVKHDILAGGRIILFARRPENMKIVKNILKRAGLPAESVAEVFEDHSIALAKNRDTKETEMLVNIARREGALNGDNRLLGLVRGKLTQKRKYDKELKSLAKRYELPIIIIGPQAGIYSFADAVRKAIEIKMSDDGSAKRWLFMLKPIRPLTDEIRREYEYYCSSLKALVAA